MNDSLLKVVEEVITVNGDHLPVSIYSAGMEEGHSGNASLRFSKQQFKCQRDHCGSTSSGRHANVCACVCICIECAPA